MSNNMELTSKQKINIILDTCLSKIKLDSTDLKHINEQKNVFDGLDENSMEYKHIYQTAKLALIGLKQNMVNNDCDKLIKLFYQLHPIMKTGKSKNVVVIERDEKMPRDIKYPKRVVKKPYDPYTIMEQGLNIDENITGTNLKKQNESSSQLNDVNI